MPPQQMFMKKKNSYEPVTTYAAKKGEILGKNALKEHA